ncbi:hypothetical protein HUU05_07780 [candidate division KSB1 bacterium]|nr:hypothetical protein [candidate division KSB1 bacterium]
MNTESKFRQRDLIFIFALGLLFRLALLLLYPVPYGNDAAGRLYFRDTIWTWHWLPATQFLVHAGYACTKSVFIVRGLFALAGALAGGAFTAYLQTFASRRAALLGGVLFTINAQFVFLSLMPYQEVLFLGLLFGGLAFLSKAQERKSYFLFGSALYGLACLTRYEAWFLLPILFLAGVWRNKSHWLRAAVANAIGLGWAPLLWLAINWWKWDSPTAFLFHRADHQFYAWAPHSDTARILNYLAMMLYWLLRFGSPLVVLAVTGAVVLWKRRAVLLPKTFPLLWLFVTVMLFLIFIAGREFATANRFASIPLAIVLVFTALGADHLLARLEMKWRDARQLARIKTGAGVVLLVVLLLYGAVPVAKANQLSEFRTPYLIAQFLQQSLRRGERAIVIGESLDGAVPMPYQRLYGQLNFSKQTLRCAALLDPQSLSEPLEYIRQHKVRYLVVFSGSWQKHENDFKLLNFLTANEQCIRAVFAEKEATVYEVRCTTS